MTRIASPFLNHARDHHGRVSKKTEHDARQSADPDHQVAQGLQQFSEPDVRRDRPKERLARRIGNLSPDSIGNPCACNGLTQALNSKTRVYRRHDSNRIWFRIHSGVNLHTTTDNPMSADFALSRSLMKLSCRHDSPESLAEPRRLDEPVLLAPSLCAFIHRCQT